MEDCGGGIGWHGGLLRDHKYRILYGMGLVVSCRSDAVGSRVSKMGKTEEIPDASFNRRSMHSE